MPRAEDVNPKNFDVQRIVFDDDDFSVVWGIRRDTESPTLGIRWNSTGPTGLGHPVSSGNPVWFVVPDILAEAVLRRLIEVPEVRRRELVATLRDLSRMRP